MIWFHRLLQIDVEIKTNVAKAFLELLLLIAQGQAHILPNTWNLLKKLCKKIRNLQACCSVEKETGNLAETGWCKHLKDFKTFWKEPYYFTYLWFHISSLFL